MRCLMASVAGFIGSHSACRFLKVRCEVLGVANFPSYYNVTSEEGEANRVENDSLSPAAPYRLVNIGGGAPAPLMDYIGELERALGRTAKKTFLPMQDGDVPHTTASAELLERLIGYKPETPISLGVPAFVGWFRQRYQL